MSIEIAEQQRGLEKDQAGDPDGGRSAEDGKQLPRRNRLDEKKKKGAEKDGGAEQQAELGHEYLKNDRDQGDEGARPVLIVMAVACGNEVGSEILGEGEILQGTAKLTKTTIIIVGLVCMGVRNGDLAGAGGENAIE